MGELSNAFVVIMGIATVFVGLICIIILCEVRGAICKALIKDGKKETKSQAAEVSAPANSAPIENKQELVAAACACISEELGCDVKNIRVLSFKRV